MVVYLIFYMCTGVLSFNLFSVSLFADSRIAWASFVSGRIKANWSQPAKIGTRLSLNICWITSRGGLPAFHVCFFQSSFYHALYYSCQ